LKKRSTRFSGFVERLGEAVAVAAVVSVWDVGSAAAGLDELPDVVRVEGFVAHNDPVLADPTQEFVNQ
jgi:hypothetical protein